MTQTQLDAAYGAMMADPDNDSLRSAYYGVLAATEVFVLLEREATQRIEPQLLEMDGIRYALIFDTDARLASFCDAPTPYGAMSGRALVEAIGGARLGLAVNPGVAEASIFVPPEAVEWMRARVGADIEEGGQRIVALNAPMVESVELLKAIDGRLAVFAGEGRSAYLVEAQYEADTAHLMVLVGVPEAARASIAGGLAEALRFLVPDMAFDTMFVDAGAEIVAAASRVGLRFDMAPEKAVPTAPQAPGSDPDKPPILH